MKSTHELHVGASVYWVKTWPATFDGLAGHHWSGIGGRVGGWVAGPHTEALREAREAFVARETLHRLAARAERVQR